MSINKSKEVQLYINTVLGQIENREVHEKIQIALESSIDELVRLDSLHNISRGKVIDMAITKMGDPVKLGSGLAWLETLFTLGL